MSDDLLWQPSSLFPLLVSWLAAQTASLAPDLAIYDREMAGHEQTPFWLVASETPLSTPDRAAPMGSHVIRTLRFRVLSGHDTIAGADTLGDLALIVLTGTTSAGGWSYPLTLPGIRIEDRVCEGGPPAAVVAGVAQRNDGYRIVYQRGET